MRLLLSLPCLPIPLLELQWLRYAGSADVRAVVLQALNFTQQDHGRAWVTDDHPGAGRPRDLEARPAAFNPGTGAA